MRKVVFENCLGTREGIVTNGLQLAEGGDFHHKLSSKH